MAEDDGTGRPVYPVLPAASSGSGGKDLDVDASELIKFKNRVDGLLTKLDNSAAAPTRLADGAVPEGDLGTNFSEATVLHSAHVRVHQELRNLSKGLAGQIEALGIAVDGSRKGYENIDDDIKRRMQRISHDAQRDWERRAAEDREKYGEPTPTDEPPTDSGSDASRGAS
ncbi:hypothetical protein ABZ707_17345 [Streptomyces sp. NPDC006923]|uniref:hypothetical protein n=1 Tax=Streptomyces sp. NPDC006923 TaxID=3155355 RepID=UPI0033D1F8FD